MLRRLACGIVLLGLMSVQTANVEAADLSGELTATFTIGTFNGTATWTVTDTFFPAVYQFQSSSGLTWNAISIGNFAIWQIQGGLNPIYFGTVQGADETGVVTIAGNIFTVAGGLNSGTWSATKLALRTAPGDIDESGSMLP